MDSNYHWQKHQANERINARRRDAEAQRLLKQNEPQRPGVMRSLVRIPGRLATAVLNIVR